MNDASTRASIVCNVSHNMRNPILFLPSRETHPWMPKGWMAVRVNGLGHEAHFVKIAVNVVRRTDADENVLPDILREWFGPAAGEPGRGDRAIFEWDEHGCTLRPIEDLTATG